MTPFERMCWGVAANAGHLSPKRKARWSHVADVTGLGSAIDRETR